MIMIASDGEIEDRSMPEQFSQDPCQIVNLHSKKVLQDKLSKLVGWSADAGGFEHHNDDR